MGPLAAAAPELITAAGQVGAGIGQGLTAPSPFQPRRAYTGTVDPENTLGDLEALLKSIAPGLIDKLQSPTTLPDAVVHNVTPFGGLSLGDVGDLAKPPSLPGMKFGNTPLALTGDTQGGDPSMGIGDGGAAIPPVDNKPPPAKAMRQTFAPVPSAQPDNGAPTDPTAAALAILRHAASAA